MKKTISFIALLLCFATAVAQHITMKNGKVYVDGQEYLTYDSRAFYSLDGVLLFTYKKERVKKDILHRQLLYDTRIQSDIEDQINRTQEEDHITRFDNLPKTKTNNYFLVRFSRFPVEFETTVNRTRIIREFYKQNVVNDVGLIDPKAAKNAAIRLNRNVSGRRVRVDN